VCNADNSFPQIIEEYQVAKGVTIWSLGGPGVALKTRKALIYLDLFTGPSPSPEITKAIVNILNPLDIRQVDAVLCTHHDPDHCDRTSLQPIHDNTEALFIGPCSCKKLFVEWGFSTDRIVELAPHDGFWLQDLKIRAMPCNDYFDPDGITYLIQADNVTIFEGGDTLYFAGFREIGEKYDVDIALLNFARNPPDQVYYLSAAQVARAAEELGARIVLPKHWDLWAEFEDDPEKVASYLIGKDIETVVLRQGDRFDYCR
jgi:L-ascorbate 6-phosphate lactonase